MYDGKPCPLEIPLTTRYTSLVSRYMIYDSVKVSTDKTAFCVSQFDHSIQCLTVNLLPAGRLSGCPQEPGRAASDMRNNAGIPSFLVCIVHCTIKDCLFQRCGILPTWCCKPF